MGWLKVIIFIIPSIEFIFSFNARLKGFHNERISVYKNIKAHPSELKMENYEIKLFDDQ